MPMSKKQAVMIVIQHEGKFLLGKRAGWKPKAPGYWCPVSGHIELGETEQEAVVREAQEEVGLKVRPLRKICSMDTHDKQVELHWWLVEILGGEAHLENNEHSELRWVGKEELETLTPSFAEDLAILKNL